MKSALKLALNAVLSIIGLISSAPVQAGSGEVHKTCDSLFAKPVTSVEHLVLQPAKDMLPPSGRPLIAPAHTPVIAELSGNNVVIYLKTRDGLKGEIIGMIDVRAAANTVLSPFGEHYYTGVQVDSGAISMYYNKTNLETFSLGINVRALFQDGSWAEIVPRQIRINFAVRLHPETGAILDFHWTNRYDVTDENKLPTAETVK